MTLLAVAVSGRGPIDPNEPAVFADDEGFLRGRAAFETLRVYEGVPFRLDDHLDRLATSAARLGLPPVDRRQVGALAREALERADCADAFLRLYVTPGREGLGQPVALALVGELPPDLDELRARGLRLASIRLGLDPGGSLLGGVKSTSYALNMVAVDEARRRGADDALFLGADEIVLEGPTTNVWWRHGDELRTPALELGILAGVTRAVLIEAAREIGFGVSEGVFPVDELRAADEAFTTSSVREVMPVVALDGAPLGNGTPGEAAAELQAALRAAAGVSARRFRP